MKKNITTKKEYQKPIKSIPKEGDLIEGTVMQVKENSIYIDLKGIKTGIVRGKELLDESGEFTNLKKGDKVKATVVKTENEKGLIELSFRIAGHKIAWERLEKIQNENTTVKVKVVDANKGGLIVKYGKIQGFLPVSHLRPKNYPRVKEGDKEKILEKLKDFIGQEIKVKFLTADEEESKLIVSEKKAVTTKKEKEIKEKYSVGDMVEGKISGIVDFGAFVTFDDNKEGLIHISELAWQRLDHPSDIVKVGDKVKAKIIDISDEGKISLSIKELKEDPWKNVKEKYSIGDIVEGEIIKVNPFGFFVELDKNIHGLAHISELSDKNINDLSNIGKVGDTKKFKIVSIEPENHRLGLSLHKQK